ncbi:MAG: hypothetical protein H5U20_07470 [Rhodobacteraceae bacterium]|nr:hypothetical protein [Paracoccaceae bacterium]
MSEHLPREVREGLDEARRRAARRRSRLRVHVGGEVFTVLRLWEGGFAMEARGAPALRGLVDLYDGARHLSECLIVASAEDGDEVICDFKRLTPVTDRPPRDYARDDDAPVALLPKAGPRREAL